MSQALLKETPLPSITVESVTLDDGRVLVAKKPLVLHPYMSPCQQYFHLDYEPLSMKLYEESFDALEKFVYEDLGFIWEQYVDDTTTPLHKSAEVLRDNLKKLFTIE